MRVLFIYPDICAASGRFQQGIGYLSSVLKKDGHKTFLLHVKKEVSKEKLCGEVHRLNPDIIGFSTTTNQYPYVRLYSSWIKGNFDIPIVCGGIEPTLSPDKVISDKNIDVVCVGEGEYPLLELVNRLEDGKDITDIKNLWIKVGEKLYRNLVRPLIENLDEMPFPDRDLFHYDKILKRFRYTAELITGRGCPFNCTYCCNHALRKLYQGKGIYVRRRSVENVLNEIEYIVEKHNVKKLLFDDDTFTLHPNWIEEFCGKYAKEFNIPFSCNAFPTTLNETIVHELKKAGCDEISIGIESGNEWLRKTVLKREVTNEQIVKAFRLAHEAGIKTCSFNMVGLPYETPEMIEDTIKLNCLINPNNIQVSVFYPYPGTRLYEVCKENGWITCSRKLSYFEEGTTLNLPTFTSEQITYYYRRMYQLSIDRIVSSRYPFIHPFYNTIKLLLGESLAYNVSIIARKILFQY